MSQIEQMIESFKESTSPVMPLIESSYKLNSVYCPYFTPSEVAELEGYYSNDSDPECKELYEATVRRMRNSLNSTQSIIDMDEKKSADTRIKELDKELKKEDDPDKIDKIKQDMVNLGWNPEIELNHENRILARKRFESIMMEQYGNINVYDATKIIDYDIPEPITEARRQKLNPIHIVVVRGVAPISKVITTITHGDFSHSGLSLDKDVGTIFSFNFDNKTKFGGGFSLEHIEEYPKERRLAVYTFFVTNEVYQKLKERMKEMTEHIRDTTYSITTLVLFPFRNINLNMPDNMICSQFVDATLKSVNINITDKDSSKVDPNALYYSTKHHPKAYKIFDGIVKDFDRKKASKVVDKLQRYAEPVNEVALLSETILPIQFNKDGDALITNPFPNFNDEYYNSHRLLENYYKVGNIEGIKYELARLYYMNYKLERKLYHNKMLSNKEENIKLRAKILNDFNKYLKYVCAKDKTFNFGEYYEQSQFYPYTVEVKSGTIGKMKDLINYIL